MSNPSPTIAWLLAIVAFAPFAVLMVVEIIYRRGRRQGLDYEYNYRDEDFDDGEQDLHAWRHIREEQE
jgi:hypothetical protein